MGIMQVIHNAESKQAFFDWLSTGNANKNSPSKVVSFIERISEYAINKKICYTDFWCITQPSDFEHIYTKILDAIQLNTLDRSTYKTFIVMGQLYLKFLEEKLFSNVGDDADGEGIHISVTPLSESTDKQEFLKSEKPFDKQAWRDINTDALIAWLTTQPNANGTLYLERVVRQYIWALQYAPAKLDLATVVNRNVFSCRTIEELNFLWEEFKSAPNYKDVNRKTSGAFSAALSCLSRYLEYLRHCDVGLEGVSFNFVPQNVPSERSAERLINGGNADTPALTSTGSVFENEVLTAVSHVLSAHFPNGFRANSPIELMRFRSYAADDSTDSIPLVDEDLKKAISFCGTLFEGKVYVVGKETESRLKEEIDAEVVSGAEIIYYSNFYARHESWLFAGRVVSEVMLKDMLKTLYPAYTYKASYFSTKINIGTELSIIKSEILRVWNGDTLLCYDQISGRLPYIPLDKIKLVFAQNGDFIWNSTEVYTQIGMIDISDEERADIEDYVANACRTAGFASMSDVPLSAIEEHNNELSLTAIHNAVFAIVLLGKYEKRGKILTRKGDTLDALILMKDHCRSIDKCTLQELLHYEQNLTGDAYPWIALEAGYAVLVRIAEDAFVAEKYVYFDVDEVDATLGLFVTGQYLPLKSVTTFATFPHCGQFWNLFLLESYCRRFSSRFRFEGLTMNSRNAGAIVRKSCGVAYTEIMADAVAASGVELKKTDVVEFLYNHGYIGRRFYAKAGELIEQAITLRERRD
jgi:hypothetical protein